MRKLQCIDVIRVVAMILLLGLLLGLTYLIPDPSDNADEAATRFVDFLQRLPAERSLYAFLSVVVCAYLGRVWWQSASLRKEFAIEEAAGEEGMGVRDRWVAQWLRKRALSLQQRADFILAAAFALLVAGIYFVLFVLPQIEETDRTLSERRQEQTFKERFSHVLQGLVEGLYWSETSSTYQDKETRNRASILPVDLIYLTDVSIYSYDNQKWREITRVLGGNLSDGLISNDRRFFFMTLLHSEIRAIHDLMQRADEDARLATMSPDGMTAIVAGDEGSVLATVDGGVNWTPRTLQLKDTEWPDSVALSANGLAAIVAGDEGSLFMSSDGGINWVSPAIGLKDTEWPTAIALSAHGMAAIVAGDEGSVLTTLDGGLNWTPRTLQLKDTEWPDSVALSANGLAAIVAGDEGSLFMSSDGGINWVSPAIGLKDTEWPTAIALSAHGMAAIVAGDEGSVLTTLDGGLNWTPRTLQLKDTEWVDVVALSADGRTAIVAGDEGSLFMSSDGGMNWASPVKLDDTESPTAIALSADGRTAIIAGDEGSVLVSSDGGLNWTLQAVGLNRTESPTAVALSPDGVTAVVTGREGSAVVTSDRGATWGAPLSVSQDRDIALAPTASDDGTVTVQRTRYSLLATTDDGKTWNLINHPLARRTRPTIAQLTESGESALLATDDGFLFMTRNSGADWALASLPLNDTELPVALALSADGSAAVVVGDEGSVCVTRDFGDSWTLTTGLPTLEDSSWTIEASSDGSFLGTSDGVRYVLKKHPDLRDWPRLSLLDIRNRLADLLSYQSESSIFQPILGFLYEPAQLDANTGDAASEPANSGNALLDMALNNLTASRIVTMTVLFFLVRILVRLHQYTLRLAGFWESRAASLFVARNYADNKAKRFDDLVQALAPDAYDFKPVRSSPILRRSPLESLRQRNEAP